MELDDRRELWPQPQSPDSELPVYFADWVQKLLMMICLQTSGRPSRQGYQVHAVQGLGNETKHMCQDKLILCLPLPWPLAEGPPKGALPRPLLLAAGCKALPSCRMGPGLALSLLLKGSADGA